ncbi:MAG: helix-turn-helix domain-containing protein [Candidatus Gastranaerophilales bacterium]|nr:helix-turn-helix domain-containing protein [Candidatus Gastranaerophilales bacterium]
MKAIKDERNKIFARNLKAERYRSNLTQLELAEWVNVSESTISLLERGLQTPSVFLVFDIAKTLKIDINELLKNIN